MRTIFKKLLCLIVSVCICFTTLPMIMGIFADDAVPQLSSRCEKIIDIAGKDTSFGEKTADLLANSAIKLSTTADLSTADAFELDVYIEDINALKAFTVGSQYVQLGFSSRSNRPNTNNANINISSQLLVDGWNHITVNKADFAENNINWGKIYYVYLKFADESQTLPSAIANKIVKYMNICESMAIPAIDDNSIVIYDSVVLGDLGESEDSSISEIEDKFNAQFEPVDLTDADFLTVNLFISDYSAFMEFMANKKLAIVLLSENGKASCEFADVYNATEINNWYEIKLPLSGFVADADFDISKVIGLNIAVSGEDEKVGSAYTISFGFANVSAKIDYYNRIPEMVESEGMIKIHEGVKFSNKYGTPTATGVQKYPAAGDQNITVSSDKKNFSIGGYVEFDYFVDNLVVLKEKLTGIYINVIASNNQNGSWVNFIDQITKNGWNHIKIRMDDLKYYGNGGYLNMSNVQYVRFQVAFAESSLNVEFAGLYAIANVCVTKDAASTVPEMVKSEGMLIIHEGLKDSGTYGNAPERWEPNIDFGANKDLSGYGFFEFDYYVENLDNLKQLASKLQLNFVDRTGGNQTDIDFLDLLTKDGWNHVKVPKSKASRLQTFSGVRYIRFIITKNSGVTVGARDRYKTANLCGTLGEESMIPDLPENVITEIKEIDGDYLGTYFGFISDRVYHEGVGPYDFSKGNVIEFDLYVSDHELLNQTMAENGRASDLGLVFSSVPLNLFSQYSKPRTYYSSTFNLNGKITKSGWNHIKVAKTEFVTLLGGVDWSNITSFMLRFNSSKFMQEERELNPAEDVYVKIANIVNTGIISDVPYDEVQAAKPDKNAVYINDAESLVDDNGSWNPAEVIVNKNYKSENSNSVVKKITYETESDFTKMFYLFDDSADMSDIKTLNFDFFVDLPQFIQKQGNEIEVGISSNRNLEGNYTWKVDISALKKGWNSLSFDISKAKKNGTVSLSEVKTIFFRFSEINLSAEDFEAVLIGIDNLRYISKNGNTVLKINAETDDTIDFDNDDILDTEISDTEIFDSELDTEYFGEQEVITETVTLEPKTIHLKETVNKVVINYVAAIIIFGIEAVVLVAAAVGFILFKKKKSK